MLMGLLGLKVVKCHKQSSWHSTDRIIRLDHCQRSPRSPSRPRCFRSSFCPCGSSSAVAEVRLTWHLAPYFRGLRSELAILWGFLSIQSVYLDPAKFPGPSHLDGHRRRHHRPCRGPRSGHLRLVATHAGVSIHHITTDPSTGFIWPVLSEFL